MKIKLLFSFLLISHFTFSQPILKSKKSYPEVSQRSVIIGQIANFNEFPNASKNIKLVVDDITIGIMHQSLFITEIDSIGRFIFDIPLYHSINTYLTYCDGTEIPYLFPNDTLYLNCKVRNIGSAIDITIVSCDEKHDKFQREYTKQHYWVHNQIKEFATKLPKTLSINELKNKYLDFEKELQARIESRIKKETSNQFLYDYVRYSATYTIYKDIIRLGKGLLNADEKKAFYSFFTDSIVFNDKALITASYRIFLNQYGINVEPSINTSVNTTNKTKDEIDKEKILQRLEKIFALRKGIWAEYLAASAMYNNVILKDEDFTASTIEYCLQLTQDKFTDNYIRQLLRSMLTEERMLIQNRDNITLTNKVEIITTASSTPGETLFNKILNDNKGKVIYLDIWATWCSSCIQQFPYSKKLHENFDDRNVAFVYLCCRSRKEASLNVLKRFQLEGTHYFLESEQYEYFEKRFQIIGIPRYILIDSSGTIINNDASGPDSEQIKNEINILINKKIAHFNQVGTPDNRSLH